MSGTLRFVSTEARLAPDPIAASYESHAAELRRFATARLRDSIAAEDIVQESFLRLAIEAQADRYPREPRAWLYRVALNLIISRSRRRSSADVSLAEDPNDRVDSETPESQLLAWERLLLVRAALRAVGPRGRTGLVMAAQGYSGREIAEVLGRSEGATRALICRARTSARRALTLAEPV